ncbi:hypothetical protein ACSBR2_039272 [Camellia fascicularis]
MKSAVFMQRIGVLNPGANILCVFCKTEVESQNHVLLHCSCIWKVWSGIVGWWGLCWVIPGSVQSLLDWWDGVKVKKIVMEIWKIVPLAVLWLLRVCEAAEGLDECESGFPNGSCAFCTSLFVDCTFPYPKERAKLVEKNSFFSIESMKLSDPVLNVDEPVKIHSLSLHMRATMEGLITKHFGSDMMDELFDRISDSTSKTLQQMVALIIPEEELP